MNELEKQFEVVEIHDSLWLYRGVKIEVVDEWSDELCAHVPVYRSCYGKQYSLKDSCIQIDFRSLPFF